MKLKNILIVAISLLFTSQIYAKQKEKIPDFSGRWALTELLCERDLYMVTNYVFNKR